MDSHRRRRIFDAQARGRPDGQNGDDDGEWTPAADHARQSDDVRGHGGDLPDAAKRQDADAGATSWVPGKAFGNFPVEGRIHR